MLNLWATVRTRPREWRLSRASNYQLEKVSADGLINLTANGGLKVKKFGARECAQFNQRYSSY
jgi:hypothetical protein